MAFLDPVSERVLACPLCLTLDYEIREQVEYNVYNVRCPHCKWEGTSNELLEVY